MPPSTVFAPDLQSWIRNANLDPDWLRIGTDIVGPNPATAPTFNGAFSVTGLVVPDSGTTAALLGLALAGVAVTAQEIAVLNGSFHNARKKRIDWMRLGLFPI